MHSQTSSSFHLFQRNSQTACLNASLKSALFGRCSYSTLQMPSCPKTKTAFSPKGRLQKAAAAISCKILSPNADPTPNSKPSSQKIFNSFQPSRSPSRPPSPPPYPHPAPRHRSKTLFDTYTRYPGKYPSHPKHPQERRPRPWSSATKPTTAYTVPRKNSRERRPRRRTSRRKS